MFVSWQLLIFNFFVNIVGLAKGQLPLISKFRVFFKYSLLSLFFYLFKVLDVKSIGFLGYSIWGVNYQDLYYNIGEVFVRGDYYFRSTRINPVIFDCGSNIGISVLYFKLLYPKSKIYVFEPDKQIIVKLKKNIISNRLLDVAIYNCALGNKEGTSLLYKSKRLSSLTGTLIKKNVFARAKKVKIKTLSSFLKKEKKIDFVKIDIEGEEYGVLQDLEREGVMARIPEMVIEYHHNLGYEGMTLGSLLLIIEKGGFNYQIISWISPIQQRNRFQDVLIYAYNENFKNASTAKESI